MIRTKTYGRLKLVLIIGALSTFGPLSMDLYLPALPSLTRDLGGSASLAQLTLTACLLGLAAGQLIAGPLSDASGRRRPLVVGVAAYSLASLLCAVAPSTPVLVVFRLIQGAAGAAGIVIARAVVRDVYEGSDVARFFALTMLISGLAPILGPVLGGQILRVTSWRGAFVFLALIGVILFVAAVLGLPETLRVERRRSGGIGETLTTFRGLVTDRSFMGYALSSGLVMGAVFTRPGPHRSCPSGGERLSPPWHALLSRGCCRRPAGGSWWDTHGSSHGRDHRPPRRCCRVHLCDSHPIPSGPGRAAAGELMTMPARVRSSCPPGHPCIARHVSDGRCGDRSVRDADPGRGRVPGRVVCAAFHRWASVNEKTAVDAGVLSSDCSSCTGAFSLDPCRPCPAIESVHMPIVGQRNRWPLAHVPEKHQAQDE
jgi:multidrug resistance protein